MRNKTVTILCSGFGLGFYIQGLLIQRSLENKGVPAEIEVFESVMVQEKREKVKKTKSTYQQSFSVALMSSKMLIDSRQSIDTELVCTLIDKWIKEGRTEFIVLTGHWMHVMDLYRTKAEPEKISINILYTDSDLAPSWKSLKALNPNYNEGCNESWLFNNAENIVGFCISVGNNAPIPFDERPDRFIVHGGGWGIGTYKSKVTELSEKGFALDIIGYGHEESTFNNERNRYFVNDPSWQAWLKTSGEYEFPPLGEARGTELPRYKNKKEHHIMFDIVRTAKAIVSKTGGGTLIDSLAAATPIIMLEPAGEHEMKNAQLWEKLGFGISYDKWVETDYSMEVLEDLHKNLLQKKLESIDYTDYYARRLSWRNNF